MHLSKKNLQTKISYSQEVTPYSNTKSDPACSETKMPTNGANLRTQQGYNAQLSKGNGQVG